MIPGKGLVIPPFIMHTFHTRQPSGVIVLANTLFYYWRGENPLEVRDTYSRETFEKVRENLNQIEN